MIGTSEDACAIVGVAINFATNFGMRNGYVYAIKPVGGIDINKKLGSLSPYPSEQEIAIPYGNL